MKPAKFEYHVPESLEEAAAKLSELGEGAKVLAGGQSLVPLMNLRLAQPEALVDLNRIAELSFTRTSNGTVSVGGMTRHRDVAESEVVKRSAPLLADAARYIGYPAIRIRGTIGGSLAHADPVSEFPCACLALDAEFELVSAKGKRVVPARDFFVSYFTTALEPDEILAETGIPSLGERGWAFREIARKTGDFALAAVAVTVTTQPDGTCSAATVAVAGGGETPLRVAEAEQLLVGADSSVASDAGEAASRAADPPSDAHSSGDFRRHLVGVLTQRAIAAAWGGSESVQ